MKNGHPLAQFKPKLQESFSLLNFLYFCYTLMCHEQERMMTNANPKTAIPRQTESRLLGGRRLTSEFHHRPTNNPNLFKPRKRYESDLLLCISILLARTNQFGKICGMGVHKFLRIS